MFKAILMDCDGVLTDGTYGYTKDGKVMKVFSSVDSKGIEQAEMANMHLAVISEDPTGYEITKRRCDDMKVPLYQAKSPEEKLTIAKQLAREWGLTLAECVFIGDDDIGDGYVLKEVGLPIAPANATEKTKCLVRNRGGYCTNASGGHGAVREAIEWVLALNAGKTTTLAGSNA